jgi:Uma2 family endonuclease
MATVPQSRLGREVEYPTSDGRPMAETDTHRRLMVDLIETLEAHFAAAPDVYVSGNLLLFYEEGNKRKHISPDVLLTRGIAKGDRNYYLMWLEGKAPDVVVEITSKTTRSEDVKKKMGLYRDVLQVAEYFLFDPFEDYLKPPMQGYRLIEANYEPIEPVAGRLPSEVLGLHLERAGTQLRLYDPRTGRRVPTEHERLEAERQRAEAERQRAEAERQRAEAERQRAEAEQAGRIEAEAENDRLRRELEKLRRQTGG